VKLDTCFFKDDVSIDERLEQRLTYDNVETVGYFEDPVPNNNRKYKVKVR
jgi:hypothetical protein